VGGLLLGGGVVVLDGWGGGLVWGGATTPPPTPPPYPHLSHRLRGPSRWSGGIRTSRFVDEVVVVAHWGGGLGGWGSRTPWRVCADTNDYSVFFLHMREDCRRRVPALGDHFSPVMTHSLAFPRSPAVS